MPRKRAKPSGSSRPSASARTDPFDFAPITYVVLDSVGLVARINLAGCRLLNVERPHILGHPLLNYVARQDRGEFLEHLRRCRTGKGAIESEVRFSSNGVSVTCRLYSRRTYLDDGEAFPTVVIDQTERLELDDARLMAERKRDEAERAAEMARAASAAKDRFLATVSHELRTPLTPALFAASRLAQWDGLPEEARKLAATIERNIEFEARLIDDLLDVARVNRERITLRLETLDVHEVVREAVQTCQESAAAQQVRLESHLIADRHHVSADRPRLRQVFWNLLNNAIKFTDAGGRIIVRSANASESLVRVTVRDSGTGMDPDTLAHLFAPFDRQADIVESRGGLGLGLAICKGIVSAHGGQIWGASDGTGRGSTFAVDLATVPAPKRMDAGRETRASGSDGMNAAAGRSRVLVIEDDADSGEMLSIFLSHYGYEVEVASSLGAGIRRLEEPWDIVLSDIGLPDGSGLEIARRARQKPQPPQKLIAFTGYGSTDDINASRDAGFDDHVVKPVDLERLLRTINKTPASNSGKSSQLS